MFEVIAQQLIDSVPAKYLLVDGLTFLNVSRYLVPIPERFPERWKQVYATNNGIVRIYEKRADDTYIQGNHAQ